MMPLGRLALLEIGPSLAPPRLAEVERAIMRAIGVPV
jgi:hypothetical protein